MSQQDALAREFEANRHRLRSIARKMLGSTTEADDAVQESWIRLVRNDPSTIDNVGGWLTTVVARVCLDRLRARTDHELLPRDDDFDAPLNEMVDDPEERAMTADSVSAAMVIVLDVLSPAARVAFVLHDVFGVPFEEIAPIVERSPLATRQLASRARRRVHGRAPATNATTERRATREVVDAFLAASSDGDFQRLLQLLHPAVRYEPDRIAVSKGAPSTDIAGPDALAKAFVGRARGASPAVVNGAAALAWAPHGTVEGVFRFEFVEGLIARIQVIADPLHLAELDVMLLADGDSA
jgi:RNA polymerase sigma-70 factor (ECF subfamily)